MRGERFSPQWSVMVYEQYLLTFSLLLFYIHHSFAADNCASNPCSHLVTQAALTVQLINWQIQYCKHTFAVDFLLVGNVVLGKRVLVA